MPKPPRTKIGCGEWFAAFVLSFISAITLGVAAAMTISAIWGPDPSSTHINEPYAAVIGGLATFVGSLLLIFGVLIWLAHRRLRNAGTSI